MKLEKVKKTGFGGIGLWITFSVGDMWIYPVSEGVNVNKGRTTDSLLFVLLVTCETQSGSFF